MLKTRLCDLFGIDHPIMNAPMGTAAGAELAAAVSEAGGFGLIGMGTRDDPVWLREQIHIARELTSRPFGVGFITAFPNIGELVGISIEEEVTAISHSFMDVSPYVADAHAAGIKVLAQVQNVAQGVAAVAAGADVIAAQGTEAGGHTGYIGTLSMVAAMVEIAGDTPVVAAGGIANGRTLAAMLLLGAEGAWVGTRFVASQEGASGQWVKQRVVEAGADDTVLTKAYDLAMGWPFQEGLVADRVLRNDYTAEWHGHNQGVMDHREELKDQILSATQAGNVKIAAVRAGPAVGLIHGIEPAGEIVRRLVAEAEQVLRARPNAVLGG